MCGKERSSAPFQLLFLCRLGCGGINPTSAFMGRSPVIYPLERPGSWKDIETESAIILVEPFSALRTDNDSRPVSVLSTDGAEFAPFLLLDCLGFPVLWVTVAQVVLTLDLRILRLVHRSVYASVIAYWSPISRSGIVFRNRYGRSGNLRQWMVPKLFVYLSL